MTLDAWIKALHGRRVLVMQHLHITADTVSNMRKGHGMTKEVCEQLRTLSNNEIKMENYIGIDNLLVYTTTKPVKKADGFYHYKLLRDGVACADLCRVGPLKDVMIHIKQIISNYESGNR